MELETLFFHCFLFKMYIVRFLTNSMIFREPTGVVNKSTLRQVQALQKFVQKQPFFQRLVSTKTDFPPPFDEAEFLFALSAAFPISDVNCNCTLNEVHYPLLRPNGWRWYFEKLNALFTSSEQQKYCYVFHLHTYVSQLPKSSIQNKN